MQTTLLSRAITSVNARAMMTGKVCWGLLCGASLRGMKALMTHRTFCGFQEVLVARERLRDMCVGWSPL